MNSLSNVERPMVTSELSTRTLQTIVDHDYLTNGLREQLLKADVLLVPSEGHIYRHEAVYFPEGTYEFYQFLKERQASNFAVDICIEDRDYKELALHFDWIVFADIFVKEIVALLVITLVVEYMMRRLGKRFEETNVRAKLIVDQQHGNRYVEHSYSGPASGYQMAMDRALRKFEVSKPRRKNAKSKVRRKRQSKRG